MVPAGVAPARQQPARLLASIPRDLLLVLALALLWRVLFFNGEFGSDDGVYAERALDVATGAWSTANYNGALRYGFNIPAGLAVWAFGASRAVVNLWPLLCSLFEVALVYVFARRHLGPTVALCAGLLLGAAPLHIAVATRLHADPVVAFFLTAAFVSAEAALRRRSLWLSLMCGLSLGMVFWTKELVAVVYLAFVPLLWYHRRFVLGVGVVLCGLALMLLLHGLLMWWIAGDPLHAVRVVLGAVGRNFVDAVAGEDRPGFYLHYLFVDLRHLGLLGWLALPGLWLAWRRPVRQPGAGVPPALFCLFWGLGLLLVLSLFPVSLQPLRFTMKQANYASLFLAPLVLLAALTLTRCGAMVRLPLLMLTMALGLLLAALQQADIRSFTANSKGALVQLANQPGVVLVGSRGLVGIAGVERSLGHPGPQVYGYADLAADPALLRGHGPAGAEVLALVDPVTANWAPGPRPVRQAWPCWQRVATVLPQDLGLGNQVAAMLVRLSVALPSTLGQRVAAIAQPLAQPATAVLYRASADRFWCADER
jgi:4-amino-4-deoxy-L-arabinose transferase-like glycosyltransferase